MSHVPSRIALFVVPCIGFAGGSGTECCDPGFPTVYGRIYGVAESSGHTPLPDVFVQTENTRGVVTDAAGHYALDFAVHAMPESSIRMVVRALRTTAGGAVLDSVSVPSQVTVHALKPVTDSTMVNITFSTP